MYSYWSNYFSINYSHRPWYIIIKGNITTRIRFLLWRWCYLVTEKDSWLEHDPFHPEPSADPPPFYSAGPMTTWALGLDFSQQPHTFQYISPPADWEGCEQLEGIRLGWITEKFSQKIQWSWFEQPHCWKIQLKLCVSSWSINTLLTNVLKNQLNHRLWGQQSWIFEGRSSWTS